MLYYFCFFPASHLSYANCPCLYEHKHVLPSVAYKRPRKPPNRLAEVKGGFSGSKRAV